MVIELTSVTSSLASLIFFGHIDVIEDGCRGLSDLRLPARTTTTCSCKFSSWIAFAVVVPEGE